MAPKLYKAAEVCEVAQLQPFVLKSWEKEFPRIGVQKAPDSVRLYRQSDLDQVLRIKDLVFREGLTLAGARRRLEEDAPVPMTTDEEVEEVLEALASDARTRIAHVRDGLRSILRVLSSAPGTVVIVDDDAHDEPMRSAKRAEGPGKHAAVRGKSLDSSRGKAKPRMLAKASRNGKPAKKKRSRANA
jgi:DNA-binding transcriptional MerR regulator